MTRRRKGASDSCFYYKWLDKALCDLQAARLLLTYGGDHYNIAFHCQQAIEKALKGYLLFRTGRHFDGHNLTYLCRQAEEFFYRRGGPMCPPISLPLRNARFLTATHIGYSPQARHKVNCPKGKRGSPGG